MLFDFISKCFLAVLLGSFVSFSLNLSGQYWAKSFSNIMTYCLLPLIGLVITEVISGNIALSLGMVGALSIIRFRHPVKSPLELTIYFLLLTLGITLTSSIFKSVFLALLSMLLIFLYSKFVNIKNNRFLNLSHINETPKFIIDIECSSANNILGKHNNLLFSYENKKSEKYSYKLSFIQKEELDKFKKIIETFPEVIEIKYTCT
mgnify:FL=1|tara:strand:- start:4106 stop:4720 length:615 start_codon:yes stop_codon:yes gene_type:complete